MTKCQFRATKNYPIANVSMYTTSGAMLTDIKSEILMFHDSVPDLHKKESTYAITWVKRKTLKAIIIFILKSGIKYNHTYLCLVGEHFQNSKSTAIFQWEQWQNTLQHFFVLIFSVSYALYTQNRQKFIGIQNQRHDTESRVKTKTKQKTITESDF